MALLKDELLQDELRSAVLELAPSSSSLSARSASVKAVKRTVRETGLHVELVGSSACGLHLAESDLDFAIVTPDRQTADGAEDDEHLLQRLAAAFRGLQGCTRIEIVTTRSRALVSFSLRQPDNSVVRCDVALRKGSGGASVNKTSLLRRFTHVCPLFRPLALLVKSWAKRRQLADPTAGRLNSFSWTLLLARFLQEVGLLPSLPHDPARIAHWARCGPDQVLGDGVPEEAPPAALAVLLFGFFSFWTAYPFASEAVSLRLLGGGSTAPWEGLSRPPMLIEDPIEPDDNTARTLTDRHLETTRAELNRARCKLLVGEAWADITRPPKRKRLKDLKQFLLPEGDVLAAAATDQRLSHVLASSSAPAAAGAFFGQLLASTSLHDDVKREAVAFVQDTPPGSSRQLSLPLTAHERRALHHCAELIQLGSRRVGTRGKQPGGRCRVLLSKPKHWTFRPPAAVAEPAIEGPSPPREWTKVDTNALRQQLGLPLLTATSGSTSAAAAAENDTTADGLANGAESPSLPGLDAGLSCELRLVRQLSDEGRRVLREAMQDPPSVSHSSSSSNDNNNGDVAGSGGVSRGGGSDPHESLLTVRLLRGGWSVERLVSHYKLIARHHKDLPLVQLSYQQTESNMANTVVQECRGLILEVGSWRVVALPFRKFFNAMEKHAKPEAIDWTNSAVYEKLDGSIMTLYPFEGAWHVSSNKTPAADGTLTTAGGGKSTSTLAQLFWQTFTACGYSVPPVQHPSWGACCYMFELITPLHTIVVRHGQPSLVCLGCRQLATLQEVPCERAAEEARQGQGQPWLTPAVFPELTNLPDTLAAARRLNPVRCEGFVVLDLSSWHRIKVKCPAYVALHHTGVAVPCATRGQELSKNQRWQRRRVLEVVRLGESDEWLSYYPQFETQCRLVQSELSLIKTFLADLATATSDAQGLALFLRRTSLVAGRCHDLVVKSARLVKDLQQDPAQSATQLLSKLEIKQLENLLDTAAALPPDWLVVLRNHMHKLGRDDAPQPAREANDRAVAGLWEMPPAAAPKMAAPANAGETEEEKAVAEGGKLLPAPPPPPPPAHNRFGLLRMDSGSSSDED